MRASRKYRRNYESDLGCDNCLLPNSNNVLINKLKHIIKPLFILIIILSLVYFYINRETHYDENSFHRNKKFNHKRKYALDFSSDKVRPSRGENRAFGSGYILLSNHTSNPKICWSFYAIGLIKYINKLDIHGPLNGSGHNSVVADIFISLNANYSNERYESCIEDNYNFSESISETNTELLNKINDIYKDPSRYYILASTSSKPNGALWSNFGGEWHV